MKGQSILGGAAAALALAAVSVCGPATAEPGAKGHVHLTFNAGAPGDPKKPFRVIEIVANEGDGKMFYEPSRIEVRRGEQIKFVIRNAGFLAHEFLLDSIEANKKHAIEMLKNPEMEHDDPNGTRLPASKSSEILWRFTKVGSFEFACLIPGHYDAGMKGVVVVAAPGNNVAAGKQTDGKTTTRKSNGATSKGSSI